jgi:hypothetical protein
VRRAMRTALALAALACAAGPATAQEPESVEEPAPSRPARPRAKPPAKPAANATAKPTAKPPAEAPAQPLAQPPAAPQPPALSLDAYAEAAATTIIAEQACPGVRLNAGQLTNLRLAARVAAGQEPALEEKLRGRAAELRQRLAADGRQAWCAGALDAFGPAGTVAKAVLTDGSVR